MGAITLEIGSADLAAREIRTTEGSVRTLTVLECDLLNHLVQRAGQTVSRDALLKEIWGYNAGVVTRAVDDAMKRLRAKVELTPKKPRHLVTVRGEGFRFQPLVVAHAPPPDVEHKFIDVSTCVLDLTRHEARFPGGTTQWLSPKEVAVLDLLATRSPETVSREALIEGVWGEGEASERVIDQTVFRLRAKLERDAARPEILLTSHGSGYRLVLGSSTPLAAVTRTNIAKRPGKLVGRAGLLKAVADELEATRLLTLRGPAGVGKSRLANAAAIAWIRSHADAHVWRWSARADCDPQEMAGAFAQAMGTAEPPMGAVEELGKRLREQAHALVVVDGAELAMDACRSCIEVWLAMAPDLRVLVTSRVPLRLEQEVERVIAPLAMPDVDDTGVNSVSASPAVQMFIARAAARGASVSISDDSAPVIAAIVRRLDGLPLAIELAAGRAALLSPEALLERLDSRFELLADRGGRSLRGALDCSWELLNGAERECLLQLSVFAGGFTVDAAEAVVRVEGVAVIDAIQALLEHSLIQSLPGRQVRVGMLESVREYAHEKRAQEVSGGPDPAALRMADHFASLGGRPRPDGRAPDAFDMANFLGAAEAARASARWETEAACLWGAHSAALSHSGFRAPAAALIASGGLSGIWLARMHVLYVRSILGVEAPDVLLSAAAQAVAAARSPEGADALIDSLHLVGGIQKRQGRLKEASQTLEEVVALVDQTAVDRRNGRPLVTLAMVWRMMGRFDEARELLWRVLQLCIERRSSRTETLALAAMAAMDQAQGIATEEQLMAVARRARTASMPQNEGLALIVHANFLADHGKLEAALDVYERAERILVGIGARQYRLLAVGNRGDVLLHLNRLLPAARALRQALAGAKELGREANAAIFAASLGVVEARRGNVAQGAKRIVRSIAVMRAIGNRLDLGNVLCQHAEVEALAGRQERAMTAVEEATAILDVLELGENSELAQRLEWLRKAGIGSPDTRAVVE